MSNGSAIHAQDIGTIFRLTVTDDEVPEVAIDVSAATTLEFLFQKPSGDVVTQTPVFTTDGTDGQLQYTTVSGDLDETGQWKLQCRYAFAGGADRRTDVVTFVVKENL